MSYTPQNPNGQATMANSSPVTLASDQSAIPITNSALTALFPAINSDKVDVNIASSSTLSVSSTDLDIRDLTSVSDSVAAIQSGTWNINNISGTISLPTGAATEATLALINAKLVSGTDIGDVTINNGAGAAAVNIQDGGNSITIDGTVAATQSGSWSFTANAGTDLNTSALLTTSVFNAAFGTAGSADSQVLSIQGIASMTPVQVSQATGSNLHTVIDSGTITTVSSVTAITNALPAGTNNIGDVDILSIVPGTGASNLGKAEDGPHTTGDVGVMLLGVRNDNVGTTFGADQDYTPIGTDLKGRVLVVQKAPTATLSNVNSSASNVTILAANSTRVGATVYNDSTEVLYLKFGTTATSTSFTVPLATNTYYEVPAGYSGIIDGFWANANGAARVTEMV